MPSRRPSRRSRRSPLYILLALVVLALGFLGVQLSPELAGWLPPELRKLVRPPVVDQSTRRPPPGEVDIASLPRTASSFEEAKKWLYGTIYRDHRKTFYCDCNYDEKRQVDLASCGLTALANIPRAHRVEADHILPAAQFGNFRLCWRSPKDFPECLKGDGTALSGRQCCEKVDPVFQAAHNDLQNLVPAVGEVNGQRKDYSWGMIPGEKREFGACNIEVDASLRRAEPPDAVKGDVARIMFYMEDTYRFRLSDQDRQLFTAWSRQDLPGPWEIERDQRIKGRQRKGNRFVEDYAAIFGKAVVAPEATLAPTAPAPASQAAVPVPATSPATPPWQCGTKSRCSEMGSCEEAKFYLDKCGVRSLDRDGDGIPCASLCQ